jgi:hypothetical protein
MAWRYINLFFAMAGVVAWTVWVFKNKEHWGYSVAPLTYFMHTAVLYLFVIFADMDAVAINNWSNAVRLHGLLLGLGFAIIFIMRGGWIWKLH